MSVAARARKFWGWGYDDFQLDSALMRLIEQFLVQGAGLQLTDPAPVPSLDAITLPRARCQAPAPLREILSDDAHERASHTYGKSFRDVCRGLQGDFRNAPDLVARPADEAGIERVLEFASGQRLAVIPYGGGSSVVGGVEAINLHGYDGVISLDLTALSGVVEVDDVSRCARIRGGTLGPDVEAGLKPHGLSLRHYPQSFEFSSLGGWIVTRSGGHYASLHTRIDDFTESVRMLTPSGVMETRRLPSHGAGPAEERLICGSEGIFGVVTEAWMRLQQLPQYRAGATLCFEEFNAGAQACRVLAQSGLHPSNARLVDKREAMMMGLGLGDAHMLIVAFESHDHPVDALLQRAVQLCSDFGGVEKKAAGRSAEQETGAEQWKESFLRAPYLRDEMIRRGLVAETLETSITWDRFERFHSEIRACARDMIEQECGRGFITCRFTHIYPDGCAPYYTIIGQGRPGAQVEQWDRIKSAISDVILREGGSITHHHAVGRDHVPWYVQQATPIVQSMLRGAKYALDPDWIMNPGVLLALRKNTDVHGDLQSADVEELLNL